MSWNIPLEPAHIQSLGLEVSPAHRPSAISVPGTAKRRSSSLSSLLRRKGKAAGVGLIGHLGRHGYGVLLTCAVAFAIIPEPARPEPDQGIIGLAACEAPNRTACLSFLFAPRRRC
jgi:hypothetical protein